MSQYRLGILVLATSVLAQASATQADGPRDNLPRDVRPIPPIGIEISGDDLEELEQGLTKLNKHIGSLKQQPKEQARELLPDVEIFARAIRDGLAHRELYSPRDVEQAKQVLREGLERAASLLTGLAPWTKQKGLVVRGFRSRLDQTVQPYGLVIPDSYDGDGVTKYRLDVWLHGRGERTTETPFIAQRMTQAGRVVPQDTIVLHPYGRYSNAFKFAGEVDVFEALEHARRHYRVDDDRIAMRGFSMGGAGCWQFAVHFPDRFFAANPGAGFSETPEFLKSFQQETLNPTWFEKKLWQMYDCTGYAANLFQLPTIAYSGELDIQKQAADVMEQALAGEGLRLTHIIGPQTKHSIHPQSMQIIETTLKELAARGRERLPLEIHFVTYTLKYNRSHWVTLTQLAQHWRQARVTGRIEPDTNQIILHTQNVDGLQLAIEAGRNPFALDQPVDVVLTRTSPDGSATDSQRVTTLRPGTDRSWRCELHFDGRGWHLGAPPEGMRKRHDLQGPIDEAFMDSFLVVRPSGKTRHEAVEKWAHAELDHFVREWRRQFRGDAVVKLDTDVTPADVAANNLILFGDPASNSVVRSIGDDLPIRWDSEQVGVGDEAFDAAHHAPVFIYPNPKNPERYVVVNSGFTYREYAYLNNARQVPKLPDWAIVDVRTPADSLWPGHIVAADFFDEQWKLKPRRNE